MPPISHTPQISQLFTACPSFRENYTIFVILSLTATNPLGVLFKPKFQAISHLGS